MNLTAIELIKRHEGLRLTAYQDSAGVWTIGYGHTGPEVVKGMSIIPSTAQSLLLADVAWAEKAVQQQTATLKLNTDQQAALISLCYNIGSGAFLKSTLLGKIKNDPYDLDAIRGEFMRWINAGGRPLAGLQSRRNEEANLYERGTKKKSR